MEAKQSYADQVAGQLIALLEKGTAPWQIPWKPGETGGLPLNPVTQKRYRGINSLVLMARQQRMGYDDSRWMTFKQAQSMGASIKKGEKATAIQYWKFYDERVKQDSEGQTILDSRGNPIVEKIQLERPKVFFSTVFNARQINGLTERQKTPVWVDLEQAEKLLAASRANIIHAQNSGAFYRISDDTITLPGKDRFDDAARYYATALHELGHWSGHETRLNRDLNHPFGSVGYAREELRAEIASMMLANDCGIGHDPSNHASYVQAWIQILKDDPMEIFRAASDAEQIQKYLYGLVAQPIVEQDRLQPQVSVQQALTDLASVTQNNIDLTHRLTAHYKKADQDRVLLVAEKLHSFREGNISETEFTAFARQKLGIALSPHFNAARISRVARTAETDQATTGEVSSHEEGWSVFIRINDHDHWLKDFDEELEAQLLFNDLKLIDALAREDEFDKNVRLKRIIEDQLLASPLASKDEVALATQHREEAERVAQQYHDRPREPIMVLDPRKEEISLNGATQFAATADSKRIYLVVPYAEKDEAKAFGAKWDKAGKSWYVLQNKMDRRKIEKWLPKNALQQVLVHTPQEQFTQFLLSHGAVVSSQEVIMDGRKRRIRVPNDKGAEKSGVYFGFLDGIPAGYFRNFRTGVSEHWKIDQHELSSEQVRSLMNQAEENRRLRQEAEVLAQKESAQALKELLPLTLAASDTGHDYLTNKQVRAGGLRIVDEVASEWLNPLIKIAQDEAQARDLRDQNPDGIVLTQGDLLVPVQDIEGNLWGAQVIRKDAKFYTKNTRKEGNFYIVGTEKFGIEAIKELTTIVIAEGYATADTVSQAIQMPVVMAFDAGNLPHVAEELKECFPEKAFVIAGDDDFQLELKNDPNVGKQKAIEAAKIVGGAYVLPIFAPGEQTLHNVVNDFNDLANKSSLGIDAVKRQIGSVVEKASQQAKQANLLRLQTPITSKWQEVKQKRALAR